MAGSTFPFTDGSVITAAGQNASYDTMLEIYTSTGFDTTQSGNGTDSDDHELTSISADDIAGCDYLKIKITAIGLVQTYSDGDPASASYNTLRIQTQDLNGLTYADSMAITTIQRTDMPLGYTFLVNATDTINLEWIHTLTADEKTYGVQVKILASSVCSNNTSAGLASLTNKQTVIERIHG